MHGTGTSVALQASVGVPHSTTGPFASIFTEIVPVGPVLPTESVAENESVVVPSAVMVTTFELPGLEVGAIGCAPEAE